MTQGNTKGPSRLWSLLRSGFAAKDSKPAVPALDGQRLRQLTRLNLKAPKTVFRSKGWCTDEVAPNDPAQQRFVKKAGDLFLRGSFDALETLDGVSVTMLVSKSSQSLNRIVPILWPDQGRDFVPVEVRNFALRAVASQTEFQAAVGRMLDQVDGWAEAETEDSIIARAIADRPDTNGTRQELHVLALAATGDWQTLSAYKECFAKGQRMNFAVGGPGVVTLEILDRAWSHAVDVAFPAGNGAART